MTPIMDKARLRRLIRKAQGELTLRPPWDVNSNIWAVECGKVLLQHYPGYHWAIRYEASQGMVHIWNLSVPTEWQINIRIDDLDYPQLNVVKVLAGEYLERFNLKRGRVDPDQLDDLPLDHRGRARPDITGVPNRNNY